MDGTLTQIMNDLLLAQSEVRRLSGELNGLREEHSNCPKPPPVDAATAAGGRAEGAGVEPEIVHNNGAAMPEPASQNHT